MSSPAQPILKHVRSPAAVQRIALVKPEKARGVEDRLLDAAKRGQLGQKVRTSALICIVLSLQQLHSNPPADRQQ